MKKFMITIVAATAVIISSFSYAKSIPQEGFSNVVKKVTPAVVNITVTGDGKEGRKPQRPVPPGGPFGEPPENVPPGDVPSPPPMPGPPGKSNQSAGSGVIISADGYIVTNNHVVEHATKITVTLSDKREFSAKIVGTDSKTDLAVINIDGSNLPAPLTWADYEKLQVGDLVLAVGSPFGLSSTVTFGIISALGRSGVGIADYEDFIQTDAAINPGNSGGALVNMNGELIGINTAIFSRTGGSEGIGFAIPSSIAVDVVDSLRKFGKVVRGWMGVSIQGITPALAKAFKIPDQQKGVVISDVNEKGPAFTAGLKRGDVIIRFDEKDIQSVSQLRNMVARARVGATVKVKVLRDGKERAVEVKIGERPPDEELRPVAPQGNEKTKPNTFRGLFENMNVEELTSDIRTKLNLPENIAGVVIAEVTPGSNVEMAGLQRGDVISEVDRKPVHTLSEYAKIAEDIGETKEAVVLSVVRNGSWIYIEVNP